jgi:hypothetical protein
MVLIYPCLGESSYLRSITVALNTISLILATIATDEIVVHEIYINEICQEIVAVNRQRVENLKLTAGQTKPDIYYIILDGFGSTATLSRYCNYDNSEFIRFLKEYGFYVASDTRSNYGNTKQSLSSSLNMNYLDFLADELDGDFRDERVPFSLIRQNNIFYCLKKLGYKIVNVSSGFEPTDFIPDADMNVSCGWGRTINLAILQMTIFLGFEDFFHILVDSARAKRLCFLHHVKDIKCIPGPKFVLVHILLPHPPYLFTATGERMPWSEHYLGEKYYAPKYVALVQFAQKMMHSIIPELLSDKDYAPIIVLQGDHGPKCSPLEALNPSSNYLQERFHPLNAYYLPNGGTTDLYQSISPVNTFRVIFNRYFGTKLPLLPDRSFYSAEDIRPFDWHEVTLDNRLLPSILTKAQTAARHINNKLPHKATKTGAQTFD